MTTFNIGERLAFTRDDVERIGEVVGWYDNLHCRTYVVEVAGEPSDKASDGRWHVTEWAAREVTAGDVEHG